jgi:mRNA interferase RelE/StbE
MIYSIEFRPSVLKSLKYFPKRDLIRIKKKIEELGRNLPEPGTTKMKGNNPFHKVRTGNYRIIYEIHSDKLLSA